MNTAHTAQPVFPFEGKLPGPKLLRSTLTSPFGRKVRIAMEVLGLSGRIAIQPADTRDQGDTLRQQNPLGKIPCLILEDDSILYDSRVIIEFLDRWSGQNKLIPDAVDERARILTRATLADGIADAALLMVYEGRFRDPSQMSEIWLDHQRGKISRALAVMEQALPDPRKTDVVSISLACALGYLDWRKPFEWRSTHPAVVQWLDDFSAAEAAFAKTERPAEMPA